MSIFVERCFVVTKIGKAALFSYRKGEIGMEYMDRHRKLQQFKSLKDFDTHRKRIFYEIKDRLSKGALMVWNELAQRSIDVPGVCWVQIDTLAKSVNVSRSTVERAIRLFKKLGVLKVEQTTRPVKGGDGANVYIFQKLGEGAEMKGRENSEKPCDSKKEPSNSPKDTKIPLYSKKHNNHLNVKRSPYIKYVPKSLQHYRAVFGANIKDLYGRVWLAAKKLGITSDQESMQQVGFITLEQLKQYVKQGVQLDEDQQRKLAYKIAYNQLLQDVERNTVLYNMNAAYELLVGSKNKRDTSLDELGVY